ncbi:hypothetical protein [Paenibacillus glycanilyticus]|uniref:hypothetical protein n=1 Tax=Paenibacillus glycanilyticus TaxID=126569 RepID=UPI000FDA56DD|nr:hypothetical protein [Paenibacillus glycanilyticus]
MEYNNKQQQSEPIHRSDSNSNTNQSDLVGSVKVENLGSDTKITYTFKNQSNKMMTPSTQVKPFDEKEAVAMVLRDHPDFPNDGESVNIETQTGGPYPGLKVDGVHRTKIEKSTDRVKYIVILTKAWNVKVNDIEAKSVWTYEVTPNEVKLISSKENADLVNRIK